MRSVPQRRRPAARPDELFRHDPDRPAFAEAALSAFSFLSELGYCVVSREPTFVRLERSDVFVQMYHGRSSYAVDLEIGREAENQLFSLHELLTAFAPHVVDMARYQAVENDVLERCLRSIAETLRVAAASILAGEQEAFADLAATAARIRNAATFDAQYGASTSATG